MRYVHNTHICRSCAYTCACTSLLTAAGPGQAAEWRKLATDMLKEKKRDK